MTWKWFVSRTVRQAHHLSRHVHKLAQHQRDILSPEAVSAINAEVKAVDAVCASGSPAQIRESISKLEKTATKWLKPYPNAAWRENIEVMLVAIAVAMGIRTFFLQPFKIPTGSMQPTLYGVTDENLLGQADAKIPNALVGFGEYWFRGVSYKHVVAKADGQLAEFQPEPSRFILFNLKQTFKVGPQTYTVWFPPDKLLQRAGLIDDYGRPNPHVFKAGDDLIKLRIISGDHLFVDRVTYNFRRPERGDIVVFETHGIHRLAHDQQDTYYIKRLCGLGSETLQLKPAYQVTGVPRAGSDAVPVGQLIVDGQEISAATPHFENLYSFPGAPLQTRANPQPVIPYRENHYFGHALIGELSPGAEFRVADNHYFVMGDNTMNSSDSRYWGDFPRERVIGKSFFVYWPIGATLFKGELRDSRFGWAHR